MSRVGDLGEEQHGELIESSVIGPEEVHSKKGCNPPLTAVDEALLRGQSFPWRSQSCTWWEVSKGVKVATG